MFLRFAFFLAEFVLLAQVHAHAVMAWSPPIDLQRHPASNARLDVTSACARAAPHHRGRTSTMASAITLDRPREGVAVITMTNPDIINFGSWKAIGDLATALREAREGGARVTVLASGVPGHWFQHAWLTDLVNAMTGQPTTGDGGSWFACLHELNQTNVVTIAAISGDTNGGGCELGWACDLRIAEEQVLFGQPEVGIGVGTGIGGTSRLRQLIGRTATAEMVLLGYPITAQRLLALGGVNRVVPRGKALEVALEWAGIMADRPPAALAGMKRMLTEGDNLQRIPEAVLNDQSIFQSFSGAPDAIATMRKAQARFDAGENPRTVYGGPLD
jgi:enoyl-CoA hydratase/carnithine racemase